MLPFAWVALRDLRLGKGFARSDGFWQSGGTAAASGRSKRHRGLVMCTDQNVMVGSKLGSLGVKGESSTKQIGLGDLMFQMPEVRDQAVE